MVGEQRTHVCCPYRLLPLRASDTRISKCGEDLASLEPFILGDKPGCLPAARSIPMGFLALSTLSFPQGVDNFLWITFP